MMFKHYINLNFDHRPKLLVLLYHRVTSGIGPDPLKTIISPRTFISQIDYIMQRFPVIPLSEAIRQLGEKKAKAGNQVVLTFDDGYRDNYEIVFPVLRERNIAAAFFPVAGYVNGSLKPWERKLFKIILENRCINTIEIKEDEYRRKSWESRRIFALRIFRKLKFMEVSIIERIFNNLSGFVYSADEENDSFLTWEQLRKMSDAGMEIGSHGLSHRSMTGMPIEEARDEIKVSKEIIERNLKKACMHFSFPFGSKEDFNDRLILYVKRCGFESCLSNIHGYNHFDRNKFIFRRIIMQEDTDLKYMFG